MSYLSEIKSSDQAWSDTSAQLVAVGIFEDQELTPLGQTIDKDLDGAISKAIEQNALKGKAGQSQSFYDENRQVLVMGLGKRDDFDAEAIRKAGGSIAKAALGNKVSSVVVECLCSGSDKSDCQALAEGLVLGSYRFTEHKAEDED